MEIVLFKYYVTFLWYSHNDYVDDLKASGIIESVGTAPRQLWARPEGQTGFHCLVSLDIRGNVFGILDSRLLAVCVKVAFQ